MAVIAMRPWSRPMPRLTVLPKPTRPAPGIQLAVCAYDGRHVFTVLVGAEHDRFCRPACMSAAVRQAMFRARQEAGSHA